MLDALAAAAAPRAARFKPEEATQLLHAFGSAERTPATPDWCTRMWDACCASQLPQFQPHELAICMWSLARLKQNPGDESLGAAAAQLASQASSCDLQALSNALWALAVLGSRPEEAALRTLVSRAGQLLPASASPQAVSNMLWAVAKLRYDPGPEFVAAGVKRALALADALRCVHGTLPGSERRLRRPSLALFVRAGRRT